MYSESRIIKYMNTFLFAWNPEKWDWTNLKQNIEELEKTGRVTQMWSCASHKSINNRL
jgi:5-methylcytosine-specific restriction enzyme A